MPTNLKTYRTVPSTPYSVDQQMAEARSQIIDGLLVILVPLIVVCAIATYRKHKATVMQRRIQRLNRLLTLNSSEKLS